MITNLYKLLQWHLVPVLALAWLGGGGVVARGAQATIPLPPPTNYQVVEQGANYRVWQRTNFETQANGSILPRLHKYTELATGLNYRQNGQWAAAQETIEIQADGSAAATHGQHQVHFPADIYNGVLEVVTSDGKHLKSRPLGISYDDGSNTVWIASLKHSNGWLTSSNQVTYPDAFDGLEADLVCTYRRSGFECDLVFRSQPTSPQQFGLTVTNSTLQLVTEFFNTDDPVAHHGGHDQKFGLQDSTLKFGSLAMIRGKAFAVQSPSGTNSPSKSASPVYKQWLHLQGRTFLIESVPLINVANDLATLPESASASPRRPSDGKAVLYARMASLRRQMLPVHDVARGQQPILVAAAGFNQKPGVVLDYNEIDYDQTSYEFQSDTTYYVTSYVGLWETTTFDGGSVIKYDESNGGFYINSTVANQSNPANPTILTSMNDDSVGEIIPGSTGQPGQDNQDPIDVETNYIELHNFKFNDAEVAFFNYVDGSTNIFWNCSFTNCGETIDLTYGKVVLRNDLNCAINFYGSQSAWLDNSWFSLDAQNVTYNGQQSQVCDGGTFFGYPDAAPNVSVVLTNCILFGAGWDLLYINGQNGSRGCHYASKCVFTNATFQTAGYDDYYLAANSPLHGAGTAHIDPGLLAEFQTMTTYAPQAGGWPDTTGTDVGYHYSVNESSYNDGVPDWWTWEYFGNSDLSATNLDSSGNNTLGYDYANGLDPNVIQFTGIEVTNNYVNNVTVPAQLDLSGGVPAYIAVSRDDTNFATDASWQAYTGTNLNLTLTMTPGWHQVWVGLKGPAANATITWQAKQLQLNFNPPLLAFTNPATILSTSSVPLVQVAGYCPEPLGSLSYDLSNALGLVTNQNAGVTSQYYDTNTGSFTTNYFACVDVPLTNGLNIITVHAMDLAGNVTTTNVSVILDYSSRTNPPVANLFWPQNGTLICNTNYTWRGWVDDPTATVSAQLVDTNGNTNVFSGLVERDGDFWVEDLPLTNGANYLTLTVTDSAGNVTMTNITVYPGAVGLTITMPDDSQLWNQGLTVSGTISDQDDYTVWVNGVQATYDDDGVSWTATNVFLPDGGTALIQARAIPNTDNGGLGTGGSGGGPVTYDNLGNPDPPQDNDAEIQVNKPMLLYQKSYYRRLTSTITDNELLSDQGGSSDCTLNETTGAGGTNTVIENTYISDAFDPYFLETSYQATTTWPSNGVPIITSIVTFNDDPWGSTTNTTSVTNNLPGTSPPSYANEHCNFSARFTPATLSTYGAVFADVFPWSDSLLGRQNSMVAPYTRKADTVWELETGGKGKSTSQNLFCLSASASEITDKLVFGVDVNTPSKGITSTAIKVDGLAVGNDGNLWRTYADNTPHDVTPKVAGHDFYTFSIGAQKYKLRIFANNYVLAADRVRPQANYCVGEYLGFDQIFAPALPAATQLAPIQWVLSGTYVNNTFITDPILYPNRSFTYNIDPSLLKNQTTYAWYVLGGDPAETDSATLIEGLTFANGQYVLVNGAGKFTMYRPTKVNFSVFTLGNFTATDSQLLFGGIGYICNIKTLFSGSVGFTQVMNDQSTPFSVGNNILDSSQIYPYPIDIPHPKSVVPGHLSANFLSLIDSPHEPTFLNYDASLVIQFTDYLVFMPNDGLANMNIYVTLGKANWSLSASQTDGVLNSPATATPPSGIDASDDFPFYMDVYTK